MIVNHLICTEWIYINKYIYIYIYFFILFNYCITVFIYLCIYFYIFLTSFLVSFLRTTLETSVLLCALMCLSSVNIILICIILFYQINSLTHILENTAHLSNLREFVVSKNRMLEVC